MRVLLQRDPSKRKLIPMGTKSCSPRRRRAASRISAASPRSISEAAPRCCSSGCWAGRAVQPPCPHGIRHRNRPKTAPKPRLPPEPAAKGGPDALGHPRRIFALDFGTELLLSRRMIYSACGLAYSLFKISCWLGRCGKGVCNPGMDVDFSQCLSESSHCAGSGQLLQPFSPVEDGSGVGALGARGSKVGSVWL